MIPANVVSRERAVQHARKQYIQGRVDAMSSLAKQLDPHRGEFISVDDLIAVLGKALQQFAMQMAQPEQPVSDRLILPIQYRNRPR